MKLKITVILLALIMILTACAGPDKEPSDTSGSSLDPVETNPAESEGFVYEYPDLSYGGDEFVIYNSEQKYNMIMHMIADEITGDAVSDSMYENKIIIEDKFKIKLVETYATFGADMLSRLQTEILSGEHVHDVAYMYSTQIGSLLNSGYLTNLYSYDNLNIEREWWNQKLKNDGSLFGENLYYLASDAHLMAFEGTWCVYFNMNMLTELGLDAPYQLAREGKWTLDEFYTLARQGVSLGSADNFTWKSGSDTVYGIASFKNFMNALVTGCNLMYVRKDASDTPYYSFPTETALYDKLDKIASITAEPGTYISANSTGMHYINDIFSQGRSLFMGGEIKAAANELSDTDFKFGIVPVPKYNAEQDNYVSNMLWSTLLMTIPTSVEDPERTAAVMDALSYLAMVNTLPNYYDRVSYRGLADDDSIEMLNIINTTRYLNWGLTYGWLSNIEPTVNAQLDVGSSSLSSIVKSSSKTIPLLIETTIAQIRK